MSFAAGGSATARGARGVVSTARGAMSGLSTARGAMTGVSTARGAMTGVSTARGAMSGVQDPATGSARGFSSSAGFEPDSSWKGFKVSDGALKTGRVLTGISGGIGCISYGYHWMSTHLEKKTTAYVDEKLVAFTTFQNVATATHQETVRVFNETNHAMQLELAATRSDILALEKRAFEQHNELLEALNKGKAKK